MELAGCPNGACPEPQLHRALRRPGHRVWGGPVLPDLLPSVRGPGCFIRTVPTGSPSPALQGAHSVSGRASQVLSHT